MKFSTLVVLLCMKTSELPRDIFGVTMYVSPKARLKEFHSYFSQLYNIGKLSLLIPIGELLFLVEKGYLAPQSAYHFIAGDASSRALEILDIFRGFEQLHNSKFKPFQISALWQKTNFSRLAVAESISLFPSVELDSSVDFESERSEYANIDVKDLQLL